MSDRRILSDAIRILLSILMGILLWFTVTPHTLLADEKPSLYVLSIGISEYQDPQIPKLKYADDDAYGIVQWAQSQQSLGRYQRVNTRLMVGAEATRANVIDALLQTYRTAGPDDLLIVFLAGHGLNELRSEQYHFLTYDTRAANIAGTALKQTDLLESLGLRRTDDRRVLILVDSCHAGAMSKLVAGLSVDQRGLFTTRGGQRLETEQTEKKTRLWQLLSAGSGEETATEGPQYRLKDEDSSVEGHGLFTNAVLEALATDAADTNKDGAISLSELKSHISKVVRERGRGTQEPEYSGHEQETLIADTPPKAEICDGIDNNHNGIIDEGFPPNCFATELCNGIDDNGNGVIDESALFDKDGDGHKDRNLCGASLGDDCNDADPAIHGGQPDFGNFRDDDCDTLIDEDDFDRNCNGIPDKMELRYRPIKGASRLGLVMGTGTMVAGAITYGLLYSVPLSSAPDPDSIQKYRGLSIATVALGGTGVVMLGIGGTFSLQERVLRLQYPPLTRPYPPKSDCTSLKK